jgi:hypothetical protein
MQPAATMATLKERVKMDEMRVWRCKNGHALGMVRRNGSGVTQLMLFRQAVDMESEEPQAPEVMSIAEGRVVDIRCSVCDAMRTWIQDEAMLERLFRTRKWAQLLDKDSGS